MIHRYSEMLMVPTNGNIAASEEKDHCNSVAHLQICRKDLRATALKKGLCFKAFQDKAQIL